MQLHQLKAYVLLIRNLLDKEEVCQLMETMETDHQHSVKYSRTDTEGRKVTQSTWTTVANDVTGAISRSEKVAGTFEQVQSALL